MTPALLSVSGLAVNPNVVSSGFCDPYAVKTELQRTFARRVAEEMRSRAMSANGVSQAAKKRGYTMSQSTVSRILAGLQDPTLEKIEAIAEALGLPAWFLMTDEGRVEQRVITTPQAIRENVVSLGSYPNVLPDKRKNSPTSSHRRVRKNR